jgi:hypothetical protein
MKKSTFLLTFLLSCALMACHPAQRHTATEPPLLAKFPIVDLPDTLHLELPTVEVAELGDSIPNALFFSALDTAWLREIEHVADSSMAVVRALGRYALEDGHDLCLVELRQNWFKHQSLLVYDKHRQAFTDRLTVAEWYGGEGGQVLAGSWLFDYDGDGKKDLVRREIEHWIKMTDAGEPKESTLERAELLLWKDGQFVPQPLADSAALVKLFPIRSVW